MGKRSRSRVRLVARQGRPLLAPPACAPGDRGSGESCGLARLTELAARQRDLQAAGDAQVDVLAPAAPAPGGRDAGRLTS